MLQYTKSLEANNKFKKSAAQGRLYFPTVEFRKLGKRGKRLIFAPTMDDLDAMHAVALDAIKLASTRVQKLKARRNWLMLRILARTGLREAELVGDKRLPGLRVTDLVPSRNCLLIRGKGWGGRHPEIEEQPVDPQTMTSIQTHITSRRLQNDDKLFPVSTRQVQNIIKDIALEANKRRRCQNCQKWVQISEQKCECGSTQFGPPACPYAKDLAPHRIRAFFITQVTASQGIALAKELARHRRIATTERYVHLDAEAKRTAYEKLFNKPTDAGDQK